MSIRPERETSAGGMRALRPIGLAIPVVVLIGLTTSTIAGFVLWPAFGHRSLVRDWNANTQLEPDRLKPLPQAAAAVFASNGEREDHDVGR